MVRRRAVERLTVGSRRVERRARARVRLRGSHRSRVAADRGARGSRRGSRLAPVRAGPRGVCVALADGRPISARSPPARSSSCRRGSETYLPPGLAHLERHLFEDGAARRPLDGSIRFLEGAGRRATLELLAETILDLVRDGIAPEQIAIVCPSLERSRASIETAFGSLGVPFAIEGAAAARDDGLRAGAALAAPLRVEQRHAP